MKKFNKFLSVFVAIAILLTTIPFGIMAAAEGEQNGMTVVDVSSHQLWHEDLENSTKEIGRIWTDKTVWDQEVVYPYEHQFPNQLGVNKGSSDLLVELSALSSAASITGKVTMTVPLDIVIVMDTSGSMGDAMPTGEYTEHYTAGQSIYYSALYSLAEDTTLYFKINNNYVPIYVSRQGGMQNRRYTIYYTMPGQTNRTYIANNVSNSNFTLPYGVYEQNFVTRLIALKDSVNAFIDQTRIVNSTISETSAQHRIALAEFAYESDARRLMNLTYVNSTTNVNSLKASVNGLSAGGATRADAGMEVA